MIRQLADAPLSEWNTFHYQPYAPRESGAGSLELWIVYRFLSLKEPMKIFTPSPFLIFPSSGAMD